MRKLDPRIERIAEWVTGKGFSVRFRTAGGNLFFLNQRQIVINIRRSTNHILAMFLHECGHLIGATSASRRTLRRFRYGWGSTPTPDSIWRMGILSEEMEAWHLGHELAGKLKIELDEPSFERAKSRCLESYVRWASKKPLHTPAGLPIKKRSRKW
jgi:hypothetical protein